MSCLYLGRPASEGPERRLRFSAHVAGSPLRASRDGVAEKPNSQQRFGRSRASSHPGEKAVAGKAREQGRDPGPRRWSSFSRFDRSADATSGGYRGGNGPCPLVGPARSAPAAVRDRLRGMERRRGRGHLGAGLLGPAVERHSLRHHRPGGVLRLHRHPSRGQEDVGSRPRDRVAPRGAARRRGAGVRP